MQGIPIFLICAPKHRSPRRFERVPTIYVLSKNIKYFSLKIFIILLPKYFLYIAWTCFRNGPLNNLFKATGGKIRNTDISIPGFPKMSSLFQNSMSNYEINGDYKTFCKYFPVSFTYILYIYIVHESTS